MQIRYQPFNRGGKSIKKIFLLNASILLVFGTYTFYVSNKTNWALQVIDFQNIEGTASKRPIKIALIDSGIQAEKANVTVAETFNGNGSNDSYGHGTAIASIIGAKKSLLNPVEGVFKNVVFYDANVLDENGNTSISDIVAAIDWAIKHEVDIINMSFGIQKDDPALHEAIKKGYEQNIIFVAAAGNNLGFEADYPARYHEVLSISSIDKNLKRDPTAAKNKVDYVTPGINVQAVKINKMRDKSLDGTSYATAYATGIIAQLLSEQKIDRTSYFKHLKDYAKPLGKQSEYGNGLLTLKKGD